MDLKKLGKRMKNFYGWCKNNNNFLFIILLFIFFVLNCMLFWKQSLHVMLDIGREFIIPSAILKGKLLYRDILNIYGPMGYLLNAGVFKLFGKNFSSLNFMGAVSGIVFVYCSYFISREFVSKLTSFALAILMCTLLFNSSLYNFLTPYSYNAVYGLASYTLSALFLIRYIKKCDVKDVLIAASAGGFCISNKMEYYWLPMILAFAVLYIRPLAVKDLLKTFLCFMIFPIFCLVYLLGNSLNFGDILNALLIIKTSAFSPSMIYLHKSIGLYPDVSIWLSSLLCIAFLGGGAPYCSLGTNFQRRIKLWELFLLL